MKPMEIVELIKTNTPQVLGKMPEKRAAQVVRAAFAEIAKQIAAADEGVLTVGGLGVFSVKQVVREKEGQKVTVKNVAFRAAKPAAAGGAKRGAGAGGKGGGGKGVGGKGGGGGKKKAAAQSAES